MRSDTMMRIIRRVDWLEVAGLLLLSGILIYFWDTLVLYPFKMLVVVFHEVSHGLAAILTGGELLRIELDPRQGGLAWTRGGWRFVVISAGYLGSLLFGGIILFLSGRSKNYNLLISVCGVLMILLGLYFVRPIFSFGFAYTIGIGLLFLLSGRYFLQVVNGYIVKMIGLVSCLYVIPDIKSDVIDRAITSDATLLADLTGIPAIIWGGLWIIISMILLIIFIPIACRKEEKPPVIEL